jgi:Protein of unknown function (DUF3309)
VSNGDEVLVASQESAHINSEEFMLIVFVVLLLLALAGGGWGHSRYGYAGWSPAGLIILVLVVMWFTGNLH